MMEKVNVKSDVRQVFNENTFKDVESKTFTQLITSEVCLWFQHTGILGQLLTIFIPKISLLGGKSRHFRSVTNHYHA